MISAISVKHRLKNQAIASGKTFQEVLMAYIMLLEEKNGEENGGYK